MSGYNIDEDIPDEVPKLTKPYDIDEDIPDVSESPAPLRVDAPENENIRQAPASSFSLLNIPKAILSKVADVMDYPASKLRQIEGAALGIEEKNPSNKDIVVGLGVSPKETDIIEPIYKYSGTNVATMDIPPEDFRETKTSPADLAAVPFGIANDPLNAIPAIGPAARGMNMAVKAVPKATLGLEQTLKGMAPIARMADEATSAASSAAKIDLISKEALDSAKTMAELNHTTVSNKLQKHVKTAVENGINPSDLPNSVLYGKDTMLDSLQRSRANIDIGDAKQLINNSFEKVSNAINNKIAKLSGRLGPLKTPKEAGQTLQAAYEQKLNTVFNDDVVRYSTLSKRLNPKISGEMKFDISTELQKQIDGIGEKIKSPMLPSQREPLLAEQRLLREAQANLPKANLDGVLNEMKAIGQAAYDPYASTGVFKVHNKYTKKAYSNIKDIVLKHVIDVDPKLAKELIDSNKVQADFLKQAEYIGQVLGDNKLAPEKVYMSIIENGDSKTLDAFKGMFETNPEIIESMRGTYLSRIPRVDAEGKSLYKSMASKVNNSDKNELVISTLLKEDEAKELGDLLELASDLPDPVNPSGTAKTSFFQNLPSNMKNLAGNLGAEKILKLKSREEQLKNVIEGIRSSRAPNKEELIEAAKKIDIKDPFIPEPIKDRIKPNINPKNKNEAAKQVLENQAKKAGSSSFKNDDAEKKRKLEEYLKKKKRERGETTSIKDAGEQMVRNV